MTGDRERVVHRRLTGVDVGSYLRTWGSVQAEDEHDDIFTEMGWSRRALDRWWLVATREMQHTSSRPHEDFHGSVVFLGRSLTDEDVRSYGLPPDAVGMPLLHYELDDDVIVCRRWRVASEIAVLMNALDGGATRWWPLGLGDLLRRDDHRIDRRPWRPRYAASQRFYDWDDWKNEGVM